MEIQQNVRKVTASQGTPHGHGISLKLGHALRAPSTSFALCWLIKMENRMKYIVFLLIGLMEKDMLLISET